MKKVLYFLFLFSLCKCSYNSFWEEEYKNTLKNSFFVGVTAESITRFLKFGNKERAAFFSVNTISNFLSAKTTENWENASNKLGFIVNKRFNSNKYLVYSLWGYVLGAGASTFVSSCFSGLLDCCKLK